LSSAVTLFFLGFSFVFSRVCTLKLKKVKIGKNVGFFTAVDKTDLVAETSIGPSMLEWSLGLEPLGGARLTGARCGSSDSEGVSSLGCDKQTTIIKRISSLIYLLTRLFIIISVDLRWREATIRDFFT